jgi:hypothetical protein
MDQHRKEAVAALTQRYRDLKRLYEHTWEKILDLTAIEIHESDSLFAQATDFLDESCRVYGKKVRIEEGAELPVRSDSEVERLRGAADQQWQFLEGKFENWRNNGGRLLVKEDFRPWREALEELYVAQTEI